MKGIPLPTWRAAASPGLTIASTWWTSGHCTIAIREVPHPKQGVWETTNVQQILQAIWAIFVWFLSHLKVARVSIRNPLTCKLQRVRLVQGSWKHWDTLSVHQSRTKTRCPRHVFRLVCCVYCGRSAWSQDCFPGVICACRGFYMFNQVALTIWQYKSCSKRLMANPWKVAERTLGSLIDTLLAATSCRRANWVNSKDTRWCQCLFSSSRRNRWVTAESAANKSYLDDELERESQPDGFHKKNWLLAQKFWVITWLL